MRKVSKQKTETTTGQALVPSEILIRHGNDPVTEESIAVEQKQLRTAKAVMFMDKVEQERIIEEAQPRLETAAKVIAAARIKLDKMAKTVVSKLKSSDEFADVRVALRAIKILGIKCGIEYKGMDMDAKKICFVRGIGDYNQYSSEWDMQGEDSVKFTQEMLAEFKIMNAAEKEKKSCEKAILEAQSTLRNRANRMSDVEGAIAIKSMGKAEQEDAKEVYSHLKGGLSVGKLLGSGK